MSGSYNANTKRGEAVTIKLTEIGPVTGLDAFPVCSLLFKKV
jgi:hypothetical protein